MNKLLIRKLNGANPKASLLAAMLDKEKVPCHPIACANWSEYPYKPDVKFRIAYNGTSILLSYRVEEADIKAVCMDTNGKVWEDSCAEFFISFGGDDFYYNIEASCTGTILVATGSDKHHRKLSSDGIISRIDRWSSLGSLPIENKSGKWELSLIIPVEVFSLSGVNTLDEKPNFHLPQFFGEFFLLTNMLNFKITKVMKTHYPFLMLMLAATQVAYSQQSYVQNGNFAETVTDETTGLTLPSGWDLEGNAFLNGERILNLVTSWLPDGAADGTKALDLWREGNEAYRLKLTQTISGLPDGIYSLSATAALGGENVFSLYAKVADKEETAPMPESGDYEKKEMSNIQITGGTAIVGFTANSSSSSDWFDITNFELVKTGEPEAPQTFEVSVSATNVTVTSPAGESPYSVDSGETFTLTFTLNDGYENPHVTVGGAPYALGNPAAGVYTVAINAVTGNADVSITAAPEAPTAATAHELNTLKLYPNPVTNGELKVAGKALKAGEKIAIYSLSGNLACAYEVRGVGTATINISRLTPGAYIVKVGRLATKMLVD